MKHHYNTSTIICWNQSSLLTHFHGLDSHPLEPSRMERVQHMTRSAIRRASNIEVNPQTKRNLQDLIINFSLILICLLLIYIIVLLMWHQKMTTGQPEDELGKILDSFRKLNLLMMMQRVDLLKWLHWSFSIYSMFNAVFLQQ